MKNIINKLRSELLNKEVELLELDNYILEELDYKADGIFHNVDTAIEDNSWSYQNEEIFDDVVGINVIWELVERIEDDFKTIVRITEVTNL